MQEQLERDAKQLARELHAALEPRATPATDRIIVGSGAGQLLWFDLTEDGSLRPKSELRLGGCPSFLALSGSGVLAVDEQGGLVHAVAHAVGHAREPRLDRSLSAGRCPAYVTYDRSGTFGLVANYQGGDVAVLRLDGSLGAVSRQPTGQNPHAVVCSPDNRHVLVPCLGSDYVAVYRFDEQSGELEPAGRSPAPPGTGPRHLVFDASAKLVYVTFEHTSEVGVFGWDPRSGQLELIGRATTGGDGSGPTQNTASHVELHPSGHALYVSNRGEDTLAVFGVDGQGGIALHARVATGKKPRHFSVSARGDRLVVGNLDAASVSSFQVLEHGLRLVLLGTTAGIPQPFFVGFC